MAYDLAGIREPIYADNWGFVYASVLWAGEARTPNGWGLKILKRKVAGIPLKRIQNIAHGTLHRIIWSEHDCTAQNGNMMSCPCLHDVFHAITKDSLTSLYYKMLETLQTNIPEGLQPVTLVDLAEIRKISAYPYLGVLDISLMELLSLGEICQGEICHK